MSEVMEATQSTRADHHSAEMDPNPAHHERWQFSDSHAGLSLEAGELVEAIDSYKIRHRR